MPALVSSEMVGGQGAIALLGHWPRASKPGPGWTSIYRDRSVTAEHSDTGRTSAQARRWWWRELIDHRPPVYSELCQFYHGRVTGQPAINTSTSRSSRVEPTPRRSTVMKVVECTAGRLAARSPSSCDRRPVPSSPVPSRVLVPERAAGN